MDDQAFELPLCEDVHGTMKKLTVSKSNIYGVLENSNFSDRCVVLVGPNIKYSVQGTYASVKQLIYGNDILTV